MNGSRTIGLYVYAVGVVAVAISAATAAWFFIDLSVWVRASSGLFVALSVTGGAVFVRLARASPFSNPDVFDEVNVESYFAAMHAVAKRLAVILLVVVFTIILLIAINAFHASVSVATVQSAPSLETFVAEHAPRAMSSVLAGLVVFILIRLMSIVHGDIGFIAVQKDIIVEARKRKSLAAARDVIAQPTQWKSAGKYGAAS